MSDASIATTTAKPAKTTAAEPAKAAADPAVAKARPQMYAPERLCKPAENAFRSFHVVTESGHVLEDVFDPEYYARVAEKYRMAKYDRILVDHPEGEFTVKIIVREYDPETKKIAFAVDEVKQGLKVIRHGLPSATIEQRGNGFAVEDGNRTLKEFPSRKMAEAWLELKRGVR